MTVLNGEFANSAFQFKLNGTTRTVNKEWTAVFYVNETHQNDHQMKSTLRKGEYKDLNIYLTTCRDPENGETLLGYAYAIFQFSTPLNFPALFWAQSTESDKRHKGLRVMQSLRMT
jgi:hypothetical protein